VFGKATIRLGIGPHSSFVCDIPTVVHIKRLAVRLSKDARWAGIEYEMKLFESKKVNGS